MQLAEYINTVISPLHIKDTIYKVKKQFKKITFTHLPVVNDDILMGMVSQNDISEFDDAVELENYTYTFSSFYVYKDALWLDVLEKIFVNKADVIPVIDKNNVYLGYYKLQEILSIFGKTPFLNEQGIELVIEKALKDYSFSEIAQIVESNNTKLLGAFLSEIMEDKVRIILKMTSVNINEVIQTFRRYGYNIVVGGDDDIFEKELQERSRYLDKYLSI